MDPVKHVNALTRRWLAALDDSSTVLSGAGVWPLLAFLADAADQPGRGELEEALGVRADRAAAAAREVLDTMDATSSIRAALGLWTDARLPLRPGWAERLPLGVNQRLSGDPDADRRRLDAWASDRTEGLIPQFPVKVDEDTRLLLASALLVKTTWIQPFTPSRAEAASGPWAGRAFPALRRRTAALDRVQLADTPAGPLTALVVMGSDDIDVHLVLGGADRTAPEVMAHGVAAIGGAFPSLGGGRLPEGEPGPGLVVERVSSTGREDELVATTVPFTVTAEHDLLKLATVFGLAAVADETRGHFPGISERPLAVRRAGQNALADFGARGFEAAAVTAFGAVAGAAITAPARTFRVKRVSVTFDRPFAYCAVHRRSGLVLAAGWVAEPGGRPDEPVAGVAGY